MVQFGFDGPQPALFLLGVDIPVLQTFPQPMLLRDQVVDAGQGVPVGGQGCGFRTLAGAVGCHFSGMPGGAGAKTEEIAVTVMR